MEKELSKISKYISLILRHKPEVIDITLDEHGWANVDELINGISKPQKNYELSRYACYLIVQNGNHHFKFN